MNATQQKFKPILFSTEMVQAILAGRKTQTRRIAPFDKFCTKPIKAGNGKWQECYNNNPDPNKMFPNGWFAITNYKPKYQPGDILWVRESFIDVGNKADEYHAGIRFHYKGDKERLGCWQWKPSIHMPKEAARIFLKVTNVRVERLQDISGEDAIAEGIAIDKQPMKNNDGWYYPKNYLAENTEYWGSKYFKIGEYSKSFESLWQSINAKKHPWESNPWVWVYEFERIEKPENFN